MAALQLLSGTPQAGINSDPVQPVEPLNYKKILEKANSATAITQSTHEVLQKGSAILFSEVQRLAMVQALL